jgi:hypothetical protein
MRTLLFLSLALAAGAQHPPKITTGPDVGARVPAFSAVDQNNQTQTLATLTGPKGLMLVFFRSADW